MSSSHRAAAAAVLHVDPVVVLVPQGLHAQEALVAEGVAFAGQGVYEEVVPDLSFPGQHQHPAVEHLALQGVQRRPLQFLGEATDGEAQTTTGPEQCAGGGQGRMSQKSDSLPRLWFAHADVRCRSTCIYIHPSTTHDDIVT